MCNNECCVWRRRALKTPQSHLREQCSLSVPNQRARTSHAICINTSTLLTYTNVHWRQMTKLSESCLFFSQLLLVLIIISIPWKKMKHLLIFLARYVGLSVKLSLWHKLANTHVSTAHWAALCVRQPIQDAYFAKDVVARRFGGILKRIKTNRALFVERALLPSRFCCCRRRRRRPAAAAATFGARLFFCF